MDEAYILLRDNLLETSTSPTSLKECFNEFNQWLQAKVIHQSRSKTEAEKMLLSALGSDIAEIDLTQVNLTQHNTRRGSPAKF